MADRQELKQGRVGLFAGKVTDFNRASASSPTPSTSRWRDEDDPEGGGEFAHALIPIYPATASVQSWKIASGRSPSSSTSSRTS